MLQTITPLAFLPPARLPEKKRTAGHAVVRRPVAVHLRARVQNADLLAASSRVHHLAVLDPAGDPIGLVSRCDLQGVRGEVEVIEVMHTPPATIDARAPLKAAAAALKRTALGALLVMDGERFVGLLTRGDLRRARLLSLADSPRCRICRNCEHVRMNQWTGLGVCLRCLQLAPALSTWPRVVPNRGEKRRSRPVRRCGLRPVLAVVGT